jgi:hypothetical protein
MAVQIPIPLDYELPLLPTKEGDACLDKKNPCGDNNQEPDDLSFHRSDKKGIVLEL